MLAEVGLVGRGPERYDFYVGGNKEGTRIPRLYQENRHIDEIISELDSLIGRWVQNRTSNEEFGDFVIRSGIVQEVLNSTTDFYLQD